MRKLLQVTLVLSLFISMPMNAQSLLKAKRAYRTEHSAINPPQKKIQPLRSLFYRANLDSRVDTFSYDPFGNVTEKKGPTILEIKKYDDKTGTILLQSISYVRTDPKAPWEEESVNQRSTFNDSGIRTAVQSDDYKEIKLNDKGYVISYESSQNSDFDRATYTWEGDKLKSIINEIQFKENSVIFKEKVVINDIDIIHENRPFNRYVIDYIDYLFDFSEGRIAYNATGSYEFGEGDVADLLIRANKGTDMRESIHTQYTIGGGIIVKAETFDVQDDNGSYVYQTSSQTGRMKRTVTYNEYGDIIYECHEEFEEFKDSAILRYSGTDRYVRTYNGNKPTKVELYTKYQNDTEDRLISTEIFEAWYDDSSIHEVEIDLKGEVLGATLYTLSGTPVRTLSATEVNSQAIELPRRGIYLLQIQTSEGVFVKKLMK